MGYDQTLRSEARRRHRLHPLRTIQPGSASRPVAARPGPGVRREDAGTHLRPGTAHIHGTAPRPYSGRWAGVAGLPAGPGFVRQQPRLSFPPGLLSGLGGLLAPVSRPGQGDRSAAASGFDPHWPDRGGEQAGTREPLRGHTVAQALDERRIAGNRCAWFMSVYDPGTPSIRQHV